MNTEDRAFWWMTHVLIPLMILGVIVLFVVLILRTVGVIHPSC